MAIVGVVVYSLARSGLEDRAFDKLRQSNDFARRLVEDRRDDLTRDISAFAAESGPVRQWAAAEEITGTGEADQLEGRLRQWMTAADLDVVVVTEAGGAVVAGARRAPDFAPGVDVPGDEQLAAEESVAQAVSARARVAGSDRWLVGAIWLDRTRLERLYRPAGVDLALVMGGRTLASTLPQPSLPERSLRGEFRARVGGQQSYVAAASLPGSSLTLLAVSRPPPNTSPGLITMLGASFAVLVGLTVLVGDLVSGVVTRPVQGLVTAAKAVSEGDLDQRVAVTGDLEMAALGHAFNTMTDNLRDQVRQLEQTRTEFGRAIARLGDVLASTDDLPRMIEVVLETCALAVRAEKAVYWDRVAMPARLRASVSFGGADLGAELNGVGVAGAAGLTLGPVGLPGAIRLSDGEPQADTAAAVPMLVDGRLFGVLAVYGKEGGVNFGADDLDTLQTFGRQAQTAIGNALLHEETRRQARTDDLTGLWNRREFELRGQEAVKQATRFGEPFGLMLVDIDDFREVNNRYSYLHGNAALVAVAAWLSEATREVDLVARWGGEEFVVLLPRAELAETAMVSERVRSAAARQPVTHGGSAIPLTVSVGYSGFPGDGATLDQLFNGADAALKRAKQLGKNRVEQARANEGVP